MSKNQKLPGCKIHHIALKTTDIERSIRFYTEGLGCTLFTRWGEGDGQAAMVDLGDGTMLELFAGGFPAEKCDENKAGEWVHLAMQVNDTDSAYQRALEFGAKEKIAPKDAHLDGTPVALDVRIAFVFGPDGETLEFFQM